MRVFFGKRPDDAYLRSPTPWGDLYQTFGWPETRRTLRPISAKVLSITSQPTVLTQKIIENNSSKPVVFNVGSSQSVSNTAGSKWLTNEPLTMDQISYEFDLAFAGRSASFSYANAWGIDANKAEVVTLGSDMEVLLLPQQSVVTELRATRAIVRIQVVYKATVAGKIAVSYNETFKGHQFWDFDVSSVMKAVDLRNGLVSKEVISIAFYSRARIVVHDR